MREGAREAESAAALISELICNRLLAALGMDVLTPAFVGASHQFAQACRVSGFPYNPIPGRHFGTIHEDNVHPEGPASPDDISDPQQLISIWVFDTLVMNVDRNVYGNLLWKLLPSGKWSPVPVDHSDCFDGAANFATGEYLTTTTKRQCAATVPLVQQVLFASGLSLLDTAIAQANGAVMLLPDLLKLVPDEWSSRCRLKHGELMECLKTRAHRLPDIIDIDRWGMTDHGSRDIPIIGL